jgi:eukaryotic-like serine/threonine-protein kinase
MSLVAGTRLGPYEIQSVIGEGGMGQVFKARDTRLDRSVAIKVLPPEFSADPDRRARFEREAKTIAGLNHPHICTLHDVGEHDGSTYLVMEHIAGETLAHRLDKGPLPLEQALTVATEIADALSAAHRQGVIHRDLKPGNVMLTKSGAKLLDFGLAKLTGHGDRPAVSTLGSLTTSLPGEAAGRSLTGEGVILGTLPYMAPEQIEGKPADARTDLWALGAILYEMLTGKRAFAGDSAASLIGNIMNAEPPAMAALQPLTPPSVDRLVRRCLAKVPDDRWDSAHDVADELRWISQTSGLAPASGVQTRSRRGVRLALTVAGVFAAALVGAALMWFLRPIAPRQAGLIQIPVQPAHEVTTRLIAERTFGGGAAGGGRTALAWTPNGDTLLFIGMREGVRRIYVRRLDEEGGARELAGTDGATALAASPDGRSVAFIWSHAEVAPTSDEPLVKTVSIQGGPPPATICRTPNHFAPAGIAWGERGEIIFSDNRLWRVPASANSTPTAVMPPDPAKDRELVALLPGGDVILFNERPPDTGLSQVQVSAWRLSTNEYSVLLPKAADARYVPTGHLVYMSERETLSAVAFDAERLKIRGKAETILGNVSQALWGFTSYERALAGQFAIASRTGHLAYLPAYPAVPTGTARLVQVDRRGHGRAVPGVPPDVSVYPVRWVPGRPGALSLALNTGEIKRLDGSGRVVPLVEGQSNRYYAWSRDGQRLATLEAQRLVLRKGDGSDPQVVPGGAGMNPSSWSRDGRHLVTSRESDGDIHMLTTDGLLWTTLVETASPVVAQHPEVSPDGRWIAYAQNTGAPDSANVWVQRFPAMSEKTMVSAGGGSSPAWNPRGGEIFYIARPEPSRADPNYVRNMMAVSVTETPARVEFGTPRVLFDTRRTYVEGKTEKPYWALFGTRGFEVAPDGQSFLVVLPDPSPVAPPVTYINVIYNWAERLKTKVPVGR